jgi:hypothetical protein
VWSSGIAVLETTNNVFNHSLYVNVVPQSLFAWHRVRLANLLAHSAPEWAAVFSQYNSGTYNNQYPVINVGAFQAGKALPDDLLWVVEQIPGTVVAGDATELLALGHFPSYNVPFWREIYDKSGYKEQIAKRRPNGEPLGELSGLDWQLAPRAKIFRRDAGKVTDMDGFLQIMRSNAYKTDPYAGTRAPHLAPRAAKTPNPNTQTKLHPGNQTYSGLALECHLLPRRPRGQPRRLPRWEGKHGVTVGKQNRLCSQRAHHGRFVRRPAAPVYVGAVPQHAPRRPV